MELFDKFEIQLDAPYEVFVGDVRSRVFDLRLWDGQNFITDPSLEFVIKGTRQDGGITEQRVSQGIGGLFRIILDKRLLEKTGIIWVDLSLEKKGMEDRLVIERRQYKVSKTAFNDIVSDLPTQLMYKDLKKLYDEVKTGITGDITVSADWNKITNKPDLTKYLLSTDLKTEILKIDGSGSTIDADLLDGKDSTAFALKTDIPNLSNYVETKDITKYALKTDIPALPDLSPYLKSVNLKSSILEIDGKSSGLDADLLQGIEGSSYALKTYVDASIANAVSGGTVDLTGYLPIANLKTELLKIDGTGSGLDADLLDGKDSTAFALKTDLTNLASKSDITNMAVKSDIPSLTDYAKKTDIPSLTNYALKTDIPSLSGYVKTADLSSYATTSSLSAYAKTTDLSAYAKSTDLANYATTNSLGSYVTSTSLATTLGSYAKTTDLSSYAKAATLSDYALKSELPEGVNLSGYLQTTNLKTELLKIDGSGSTLDADLLDGVDGSLYARKTDIPSLTNYALRSEIPAVPNLTPYLQTNNLLTELLKVDGENSKLDADLLDGLDSTQFWKKTDNLPINNENGISKNGTEVILSSSFVKTTTDDAKMTTILNYFINNTAKTVLVIDEVITLSSSLTLPASISIIFTNGGRFIIGSGLTLTVNSSILNTDIYMFELLSSTSKVIIPQMETYNSKWFGVKGDGVTNDTISLQRFIDMCNSNNYSMQLDGEFLVSGIKFKGVRTTDDNFPSKSFGYAYFYPLNNNQSYIIDIDGPFEWYGKLIVDGKEKALNGIIARNIIHSHFTDLKVMKCKVWGFDFEASGNNAMVEFDKLQGNYCGTAHSSAFAIASSTTIGGDTNRVITLGTPLDAGYIARPRGILFAIYNGRPYKVNNVVSINQIGVLNLPSGASGTIEIMIGGALNIQSFGDNGVCNYGTVDMYGNKGIAINMSGLYGHNFDNLVAQGNRIAVSCEDISIGVFFNRPYFEVNTVNIVVWNYIVGTMIDPVIQWDKMFSLVQHNIYGYDYFPSLNVMSASNTEYKSLNMSSDYSSGSTGSGSKKLFPSKSYAYGYASSITTAAFVIQNKPLYKMTNSNYISMTLNCAVAMSMTFTLLNTGETIEGSTSYVLDLPKGKHHIQITNLSGRWTINRIQADAPNMVVLTQSEFDSIQVKDSNTVYIVK